jgi:hypothetical protein
LKLFQESGGGEGKRAMIEEVTSTKNFGKCQNVPPIHQWYDNKNNRKISIQNVFD